MMTKEEAERFHREGTWRQMTSLQLVEFQIYEERLAFPYQVYKKALVEVLGRSINSLEILNDYKLQKEFEQLQKKYIVGTEKTIVCSLPSCARCQESHKQLTFTQLQIFGKKHTHWALCPNTNEPIMLWITQNDDGEE